MRSRLPKYIYTPDYARAFLTISADVHGNFSAGYTVWGREATTGDQITYCYGPFVNDCLDIDSAIIQLFNLYQVWAEE